MSDPLVSESDALDPVAEEFVERLRRGEHPAMSEFAERYPHLAERIRDLFPALVEMEQVGTLVSGAGSTPRAPALQRLGEYRIVRELGRGGMGVVYEAVQESLGRRVALKVLPPGAGRDASYLERFRREAKIAAKLHHPNIVPVFGVGEVNGTYFYAMQYIEGSGLDQVLAEVAQLRSGRRDAAPAPDTQALAGGSTLIGQSEDRYFRGVAQLGVQVADGLAHAHAQGVLHRDIKPSNLILDPGENVWITDFGLAKIEDAENLTASGDVVGTLRYMAPERFRGESDERSDVYALGVTLYELVTLRPAFSAADRAQLVRHVAEAEPPRPRQVNPHVPRDLETIVLKAMAKEPGGRYAGAARLADDLRRFLDDKPIQARRAGAVEQAWRWCRRNRAIAALAAGLFLALTAGLAGTSWKWLEADRQRISVENANQATGVAFNEATTNLYESLVDRAWREWQLGDIPRASDFLEKCPPERRQWEWHYLRRLVAGPQPKLEGCNGAWRTAFSADGSVAATVKAWEVCVWREEGHAVLQGLQPVDHRRAEISSLSVSDDGGRVTLVSRLFNHRFVPAAWRVQSWDRSGRESRNEFGATWDAVTAVPLANTTALLVTGRGVTWVLDPSRPDTLFTPVRHEQGVTCQAWSKDRRRVALATADQHISIRDLPSGALLGRWPARTPARLEFNADGSLLMGLIGQDDATVWDVPSGIPLFTLRTDLHARGHARWTYNGIGTIRVPFDAAWATFRPDGQRIAVLDHPRVLKLYDARDGTLLSVWRLPVVDAQSITFHPDCHRVAASAHHAVLFAELPSNQEFGNRSVNPKPAGATLLSEDGRRAIAWTPEAELELFNAAGTEPSARYAGHRRPRAQADKVRTRDGQEWSPNVKRVDGVLATADLRRVGSYFDSQALHVWDIESGRTWQLLPGHADAIIAAAFTPDGRFAATSGRDDSIRVYETETSRLLAVIPAPNSGITRLALSPDGERVAYTHDRRVFVVHWPAGKEAVEAGEFAKSIHSLTFHPGGRRAAALARDGALILWDTDTGHELLSMKGPPPASGGPCSFLRFSSDGHRLTYLGEGLRLFTWDGTPLDRPGE